MHRKSKTGKLKESSKNSSFCRKNNSRKLSINSRFCQLDLVFIAEKRPKNKLASAIFSKINLHCSGRAGRNHPGDNLVIGLSECWFSGHSKNFILHGLGKLDHNLRYHKICSLNHLFSPFLGWALRMLCFASKIWHTSPDRCGWRKSQFHPDPLYTNFLKNP